jgi:FMN reductase
MATVLAVSGSPSPRSFTHTVAEAASRLVRRAGYTVDEMAVRELPAAALLAADTADPVLAAGLRRVAAADGIILATPVYKAAYSGMLKAFLDALPQFGLDGKVVLPLATGGSSAHALALDYALRPVLMSMRPALVTEAVFVPRPSASGAREPDGPRPWPSPGLERAVDHFTLALGPPADAISYSQPNAGTPR